ncbi:MAG: ATP-binding protein [Steroidobacteraceae bacterium]
MEKAPPAQRRFALRSKLRIGAVLALLSLLASGVLNFHGVREARQVRQEMLAAQEVLRGTNDLRFDYSQVVGDLRAHMLTGVERYRNDFRAGQTRLRNQLQELETGLAHDTAQTAALAQLREEFTLRDAQFERALLVYGQGGSGGIGALASDPEVIRSSTRVRDLLEEIRSRERTRFDKLVTQDRETQDRLTIWITVFVTLAVAISVWLAAQLLRELKARERAEHNALWQQRFSDAVIEHLPVMLYLKDATTLKLIRVNKAVERLTGRSREDMLGKDDSQFFPPHIAEAYMANERRFVDEYHGEMSEEVPLDTPEGRRILAIHKVVVDDEHGRPAYLLGTSTDITDRLESERRLRQFSNELGEKTHALEAANRELESFSYTVSHDLRAPLRAVDGYAAILEEDYAGAIDEEGRRYLRAVRDGAARMGQLIQDLLTFSRLGRTELEHHVTATHQIIEAAWQQVLAGRSGPPPELVVGDLPSSLGDPRLLTQVWVNLLDNAAKYSANASAPRVRVTGKVEGNEATFSVEDNGAGFDMKYYDKLFKVFQRLHRDADYSGTGVGLAIVQRVVARHGGRVWADSIPGRGATFSFTLPIS